MDLYSNLLYQEVTGNIFKNVSGNDDSPATEEDINDILKDIDAEETTMPWGTWVLQKVVDIILLPVKTFNFITDTLYWAATGQWTKENTTDVEETDGNRSKDQLQHMEGPLPEENKNQIPKIATQ
ncbi:uncharacterized protein LOC143204608 isoform X2 [Rhynchophorus ferrugineus]|uniref:Uncharacterized protein n=1 Tax=Rhynchophorus ferrugineus TaxID=354439 RepID=A0A834MC16_RHYFE|nr:hypothetical protein GWI33_012919 [Rhynchophorus ferrugineus]